VELTDVTINDEAADRVVAALEKLAAEAETLRILRERELNLEVVRLNGRLYVQGRQATPAPAKEDARR
jgi:hypothetical protein